MGGSEGSSRYSRGCRKSGDVRGLVSRVGIGRAASHFVDCAGGVEGAIGGTAALTLS